MTDFVPPPPLITSEGDLCRLWAAQRFSGPLATTDGEVVRVIYPGRPGGGRGPDFRGAILADAGGHLRTGDVELHLHARDWVGHGHRADPAYNQVILHVVLLDDGSACLRADGVAIAVCVLSAVLVATPPEPSELTPTAICRVSPALLTEQVRVLVRRAGWQRLEEKAVLLEGQRESLGAEQALFTALLDALGYSRNRLPCQRLAERLPVEQLYALICRKTPAQAEDIARTVLLGLAGLRTAGANPVDDALWAHYADLWMLPPLRPDAWVRAGVRPANQPVLRLKGMARLLVRSMRQGLVESLMAPISAGDSSGLLVLLQVEADDPPTALPYIGPGRAAEMAINVVLPFALMLGRVGTLELPEESLWRLATEIPAAEEAEPHRYMRALLKASGHRLHAPGALEAQGLLHLYRSYCSVGACWECPLARGVAVNSDQ